MNALDLLDNHLDNIAIALRPTKPFDPANFPAVRKIEWAIKDLPKEHAYAFDSTGMPIGMAKGTDDGVDFAHLDPRIPFDAPITLTTHNHPGGNNLSSGDISATFHELDYPMRAVTPEGDYYQISPPNLDLDERPNAKELIRINHANPNRKAEISRILSTLEKAGYPMQYQEGKIAPIDNDMLVGDSFSIRRNKVEVPTVVNSQGHITIPQETITRIGTRKYLANGQYWQDGLLYDLDGEIAF